MCLKQPTTHKRPCVTECIRMIRVTHVMHTWLQKYDHKQVLIQWFSQNLISWCVRTGFPQHVTFHWTQICGMSSRLVTISGKIWRTSQKLVRTTKQQIAAVGNKWRKINKTSQKSALVKLWIMQQVSLVLKNLDHEWEKQISSLIKCKMYSCQTPNLTSTQGWVWQ